MNNQIERKQKEKSNEITCRSNIIQHEKDKLIFHLIQNVQLTKKLH